VRPRLGRAQALALPPQLPPRAPPPAAAAQPPGPQPRGAQPGAAAPPGGGPLIVFASPQGPRAGLMSTTSAGGTPQGTPLLLSPVANGGTPVSLPPRGLPGAYGAPGGLATPSGLSTPPASLRFGPGGTPLGTPANGDWYSAAPAPPTDPSVFTVTDRKVATPRAPAPAAAPSWV